MARTRGLQLAAARRVEPAYVQACRFNRTVPTSRGPENQRRWLVLERAKKRLFYTLAQLNLPLINGWDDPQRGLLMDFIEDARLLRRFRRPSSPRGTSAA
jgi:hypothetical protein